MTILEYIRQIRAHRRRMVRWGRHYEGPTQHQAALKKALEIHDIEKWAFLPLLLLFRKNKGDSKLARKVYDVMNAVGARVSKVLLDGFPERDVAQARNLERVFDCLDRHLDPVARIELGDSNPPLSKFLTPEQLVVAEHYKRYWPEVNAE